MAAIGWLIKTADYYKQIKAQERISSFTDLKRSRGSQEDVPSSLPGEGVGARRNVKETVKSNPATSQATLSGLEQGQMAVSVAGIGVGVGGVVAVGVVASALSPVVAAFAATGVVAMFLASSHYAGIFWREFKMYDAARNNDVAYQGMSLGLRMATFANSQEAKDGLTARATQGVLGSDWYSEQRLRSIDNETQKPLYSQRQQAAIERHEVTHTQGGGELAARLAQTLPTFVGMATGWRLAQMAGVLAVLGMGSPEGAIAATERALGRLDISRLSDSQVVRVGLKAGSPVAVLGGSAPAAHPSLPSAEVERLGVLSLGHRHAEGTIPSAQDLFANMRRNEAGLRGLLAGVSARFLRPDFIVRPDNTRLYYAVNKNGQVAMWESKNGAVSRVKGNPLASALMGEQTVQTDHGDVGLSTMVMASVAGVESLNDLGLPLEELRRREAEVNKAIQLARRDGRTPTDAYVAGAMAFFNAAPGAANADLMRLAILARFKEIGLFEALGIKGDLFGNLEARLAELKAQTKGLIDGAAALDLDEAALTTYAKDHLLPSLLKEAFRRAGIANVPAVGQLSVKVYRTEADYLAAVSQVAESQGHIHADVGQSALEMKTNGSAVVHLLADRGTVITKARLAHELAHVALDEARMALGYSRENEAGTSEILVQALMENGLPAGEKYLAKVALTEIVEHLAALKRLNRGETVAGEWLGYQLVSAFLGRTGQNPAVASALVRKVYAGAPLSLLALDMAKMLTPRIVVVAGTDVVSAKAGVDRELERTIDTLLAQRVDLAVEVIIADNGLTDAARNLLEPVLSKPGVRLLSANALAKMVGAEGTIDMELLEPQLGRLMGLPSSYALAVLIGKSQIWKGLDALKDKLVVIPWGSAEEDVRNALLGARAILRSA